MTSPHHPEGRPTQGDTPEPLQPAFYGNPQARQSHPQYPGAEQYYSRPSSPQYAGAQPYGGPPYGGPPNGSQPKKKRNTLGIIALAVAIIGAIFACIPAR